MHSRRTLGIFAAATAILAALSFAIVDVSIAQANGCMGASACDDRALPIAAITFAALGVLSLLVCIVPAVTWFRGGIHRAEHELSTAEIAWRGETRPLVAASFEEIE